jgi:putative ABC transport system substrate-binding protein
LRSRGDLDAAFSNLNHGRVVGVMTTLDAMIFNERKRIANLALANRLPTLVHNREMVEAGGLISYGPSFPDLFRRAAGYVVKIVKGAKPSELPVEQPTKFDLAINLKTAKTLGVTIPPTLLARADEVIE